MALPFQSMRRLGKSLSFNTGLLDCDGNEIFTGDFLRHFNDPQKRMQRHEVEYLEDKAGFFMWHIESDYFWRTPHGADLHHEWIARTEIIHKRLDQETAQRYRIVGNIVDGETVKPPRDPVFEKED